MDLSEFKPGSVVETKKQHPCGGVLWEIIRTGADIKIKCLTCGRALLLLPDELKRRVRRIKEGV